MKRTLLAALVAIVLFVPRPGFAHCQMPCGIYDDPGRIAQLKEDSATIAKAVTTINELAGKTDAQSWNQVVRWTNTKEEHASAIIDVVAEYFLLQRVKTVAAGSEGYADYLAKLADHHAVMVAAMKVKQTVSPESVAALDAAIAALAKRYP